MKTRAQSNSADARRVLAKPPRRLALAGALCALLFSAVGTADDGARKEIVGNAPLRDGARAPALAQLRPQVLEAYRADVFIDGQPAPASAATIDIVITRWTTPETRNALLAALTRKGEKQMRNELSRQRATGYVQLATGPRYELRYAWQEPAGKGRRIVLLSDRIVPFIAAWSATGAFQHRITAFWLELEAEGAGSGTVDVGVKISVPPETLQLLVEDPTPDNLELREVSQTQ